MKPQSKDADATDLSAVLRMTGFMCYGAVGATLAVARAAQEKRKAAISGEFGY